MSKKVKEENAILMIWRTLVSSSNKEESDIERQVKEIEDAEDKENIGHLLNLVKAPSIKKAKFNEKNIKAKVSSNNIRGTKQIKEQQEEKSLDER